MNLNIGRVLGYMFEDPEWVKKVLIGGLLLLIPIIGIALDFGYFISHYKNMKSGKDIPLPEWKNFGNLFKNGIKFFGAIFIYAFPVIFLEIIYFGIQIYNIYLFVNTSGQKNLYIMHGKIFLLPLVGMFIYFFIILYSFFLNFIIPGIIIEFTENFSISDCLKLSEIFPMIKENFLSFFIVFILFFAINMMASIGFLLCCVGILFTSFIGIGMYFRLVSELDNNIKKI